MNRGIVLWNSLQDSYDPMTLGIDLSGVENET
jgi:hypothetical protein